MPRSELIQSVVRGLDVLQLAAKSEAGVTLRQMCQAIGLKQPTAHNLVRTLLSRGFLERSGRPMRYRLGPTFQRLAMEHQNHSLAWRASEAMLALQGELLTLVGAAPEPHGDDSLTFGRLLAGDVVMCLRLQLEGPGLIERPGFAFAPYDAAVALLFQAYMLAGQRDLYWRQHPFARLGAMTWKTPRRLDDFLAEVRRVGYCLPQHYGPETFRMAVPVFGPDKTIVGALGLGVWRRLSRSQRQQCIKRVRAVARQLSEERGDNE